MRPTIIKSLIIAAALTTQHIKFLHFTVQLYIKSLNGFYIASGTRVVASVPHEVMRGLSIAYSLHSL